MPKPDLIGAPPPVDLPSALLALRAALEALRQLQERVTALEKKL